MNPPHPTIEMKLAAAHRAGDRAELNQLLNGFRPFLESLVNRRFDRRMQARLDPTDIVQEVLVEVTYRLGDYLERRPMSFRAWLYQTACQRLQMAWREHCRAQRRAVDREVPFIDDTSLQLACSLIGRSPSDELQRRELIERTQQAIDRLPKIDRDLIVMRTFDNLDNGEVAELLGIQPSAASKRYGRALLRLREQLLEVMDST